MENSLELVHHGIGKVGKFKKLLSLLGGIGGTSGYLIIGYSVTVHVEQQSDRRFADDIFKCISLSITICIVTEYWFNFVLKGPIVNIGVVSSQFHRMA